MVRIHSPRLAEALENKGFGCLFERGRFVSVVPSPTIRVGGLFLRVVAARERAAVSDAGFFGCVTP